MATKHPHKYGLGDFAEPCERCGLEWGLGAGYPELPCSGTYNGREYRNQQALYDLGDERFHSRAWEYASGRWGELRPEVRALIERTLGLAPVS